MFLLFIWYYKFPTLNMFFSRIPPFFPRPSFTISWSPPTLVPLFDYFLGGHFEAIVCVPISHRWLTMVQARAIVYRGNFLSKNLDTRKDRNFSSRKVFLLFYVWFWMLIDARGASSSFPQRNVNCRYQNLWSMSRFDKLYCSKCRKCRPLARSVLTGSVSTF